MGVNTGLYLDDELFAFAKKRASEAEFKGKVNAYMADLVRRDRDGNMGGASSDLFANLCRDAAPELADTLEEKLFSRFPLGKESAYQRRFLGLLLTALAEALESPGFDPMKPFRISDARAGAPTNEQLKAFIQSALKEAMDEPLGLAAEDTPKPGGLSPADQIAAAEAAARHKATARTPYRKRGKR
jgi:hypothetical protein